MVKHASERASARSASRASSRLLASHLSNRLSSNLSNNLKGSTNNYDKDIDDDAFLVDDIYKILKSEDETQMRRLKTRLASETGEDADALIKKAKT